MVFAVGGCLVVVAGGCCLLSLVLRIQPEGIGST